MGDSYAYSFQAVWSDLSLNKHLSISWADEFPVMFTAE